MAYRYLKDPPRRIVSDKVLCDKAFTITSDSKYNRYNRGLALVACKLFNNQGTTNYAESGTFSEVQQIANELYKLIS